MLTCRDCGRDNIKSPQGMVSHRRARHPDGLSSGSNVEAARQTIDAIREAGRLEPIDSAQVQGVMSIAAALDLSPFNSQMWREYREAIGELRADDGDDGIDALLAELSGPEVRDPTAG